MKMEEMYYCLLILLYICYYGCIIFAVIRKKYIKYVYSIGILLVCLGFHWLDIEITDFYPIKSLVVGIFLYVLSVFMKNGRITPECFLVITKGRLYRGNLKKLVHSIWKSSYEELLWRNSFIVFSRDWWVTYLLSFLFAVSHFKKKIKITEICELFIFSLLEYYVIIYTQNILNCIIIHAVRNICVILLQVYLTERNKDE